MRRIFAGPIYCAETGKVVYDKRGAASAKNARFKRDHKTMRIYPCHNHWHLTSVDPHSYGLYVPK